MGAVQVSRAGESYTLVGDSGEPISPVAGFLRFLRARGCSPNTEAAYAYDLVHFFRFLDVEQISYQEFTPARALRLLTYLRVLPNRSRARRLRLVPVVVPGQGQAAPGLAPSSINHIISTVSAFYEYLILAGEWTTIENPILNRPLKSRLLDHTERARSLAEHATHCPRRC